VLMPTLSRALDVGERDGAERIVAVLLRLLMMLTVPVVMGALMMGPSLIGLLANPEIGMASRWVTPLIALGAVCFGVVRVASLVAFVLGRTRTVLMGTAIGAAVKIVLCLLFLPMFRDLTIAAAATLAGYVFYGCYIIRVLRPVWRLSVDWGSLLRVVAASLAMGAVLWLLGYRPGEISGIGPAGLALGILAGAVSYFLSLAALGGIGRQDLRQLGEILRARAGGGAAELTPP